VSAAKLAAAALAAASAAVTGFLAGTGKVVLTSEI
jgi:hypothetical protein